MKKIYHLLFILTVLTLNITAQEKKTQNIETDVIVYITKTGTKYHAESCSYLKGNGIQKKLSEVKDRYSPCSRCYVSGTANNPDNKEDLKAESKEVTTKDSSVKKEEANEKTSSGQTIYTGPRGGKYYINKNGKKTYIKH